MTFLAWFLVAFGAPDGWDAKLPKADGMEELPPADLDLRVEASGVVRVSGVPGEFPAEPIAPAAGLSDAVRAATPAPSPNRRAALHVDRRAAFLGVRNAVLGVSAARYGFVDLVGGRGDRGFPIELGVPGTTPPGRPDRPPLTVHLRPDGLWIGRNADAGIEVRLPDGGKRDRIVERLLDVERELHPGDRLVVISTDDPVPYDQMFRLVAATRARNYPLTILVGGPVIPEPAVEPSPVPSVAPVRPDFVRILPTGSFVIDGEELPTSGILQFVEDCTEDPCTVAAVPKDGPPVLVGTRPWDRDPAQAWIYARPVVSGFGYARGVSPPRFEGTFLPLPRIEGSDEPQDVHVPPEGYAIRLGANDRAFLDEIVRKRSAEIRACYQRGLASDPTLAGRVLVEFTIEPDGTVGYAGTASSALTDPAVVTCVLAQIRQLRFPAPRGGGQVEVRYPFQFAPDDR